MALRRRPTRAIPRATYTEWWWPPPPTIFRTIPAGYTSFEQVIRPELDPGSAAPYLCAYEFRFVGGVGGFVGLETQGQGVGKAAVFSVPDAMGSSGLSPIHLVPYPWEAGGAYRVRVWTEEPGRWYGAVRDERSGAEQPIGYFDVPGDWRRLGSWSRTTIEYRGVLSRCSDLFPVQVAFSVPTADGGTVRPQLHQSRLGDGTCDGSSVEDMAGGVRHAMGIAF